MLEDDISGRTITGVWAGDSVPALTLPQPHFVPAGTKGSLWNSSFKDFLGFSAVINGSDALSVYVIVTQLHGLQKYSCGHKLYHLKIWNNRSKFEYMGYQSLQKHSSKRAVEWNLAGDRFQDHSFIQGGDNSLSWTQQVPQQTPSRSHSFSQVLESAWSLLPLFIFCITRGFILWRLSGVAMRVPHLFMVAQSAAGYL